MPALIHPQKAVLEANLSFYEAFAAQNLTAMDRVWARNTLVACLHPGWPALYGREQVMASWRSILQQDNGPPIRCADPKAFLMDEAAFVICTERLGTTELAATNIFAQEDGLWKMVHHQAAPFSRRQLPVEMVPPKNELN